MKMNFSHLVTATLAAVGGAALVFTLVRFDVLGFHGASPRDVASSAQEVTTPVAKVMYNCPMHPHIIRDQPGTCPICGMDLVPMKDHDHASAAPADAIKIEASMIQSIGVNTVAVEESELTKSVYVNGTIAIDPENIAVVNARSMGWIESIPQGTEGTRVFAGQKLASFYSPDLVAAQEDFLQAIRARDESLTASARKRLEVLGVSAAFIDSIRKDNASIRSLPVVSPISGVVLERLIVQGQNVMPGSDLYRIADLSHVWGVGKAYPEDIAKLKMGMNAKVILQGMESAPRDGKIIFIAPIVDPETKTTEIRVDIKNTADLSYKPGMNADLRIQIQLGAGIAIPAQAVIRTGERTVAIVALGKGYFAPRDLTLGEKLGDSVQVLEGLNPGDSLVTSAQFLIDSESNLKKAVQSFGSKGGAHAGHNN